MLRCQSWCLSGTTLTKMPCRKEMHVFHGPTTHTLQSCSFHDKAEAILAFSSRNKVVPGSKLHACTWFLYSHILFSSSLHHQEEGEGRGGVKGGEGDFEKYNRIVSCLSFSSVNAGNFECRDHVVPVFRMSLCWNNIWHMVTAK